MFWLLTATVSYFLNASAAVIDKFLLHARIPSPATYTFYTGIFSIGVVVLIPFSFSVIEPLYMVIAFFSGAMLLAGLYFFYLSIKKFETSVVVPLIVGVFTPLLTFVFAITIKADVALSSTEFLAFLIFILGGLILTLDFSKRKASIKYDLIYMTFFSGLFFSASFSAAKLVYSNTEFISGFIWMRLGSVVAVLILLLIPFYRKNLRKSSSKVSGVSLIYFIINKMIGAAGFFLFQYAISLGSVSIINALKGLEYFFVFLIVFTLSVVFPKTVNESFNTVIFAQKFAGIFIIGTGLFVLFYMSDALKIL